MFAPNEQTACVIAEIRSDRDLVEIAGGQRNRSYPWFLDSAAQSARLGRFSFLGADPYLVVRARGDALEVECRRAVRAASHVGTATLNGDPLECLRTLMPAPPADARPPELPFCGGAVGYLGYELAEHFDCHRLHGADDLQLPDAALLFVDWLIAYDAIENRLFACGLGFDTDLERARQNAKRACDVARERASDVAVSTPRVAENPGSVVLTPGADASAYAKAIDAAKHEIDAGEVYQTCLTRRIAKRFEGDPWALYRELRAINPAPFASYFEMPEVAIVSSSPERFLRVDAQRHVESRPIKGTRPRGCTDDVDRALRAELAASAKDRAENLMIVDLVRNDIGRVCETGSVEVPELMAIESYASVHQMVSTVRGRLRGDRDAFDAVRHTFPPGSMTGAPKIAAMRILDRFEPVRRAIYSGAIGYFDVRGGADLCVVIRTILVQGGNALVHTGGGIVADSDPAQEWSETVDKARPLLQALESTPDT